MAEADEKPDRIIDIHTPRVFALRQPADDAAELVITTTARQSHVYTLTYQQVCLLAMQAEKARLNWPKEPKVKPDKDKS